MYKKFGKRILDFFISLIALIVLAPIILIIAIIIKIILGDPIIFKQKRPGKDEKIFILYKFRSMSDEEKQA